MKCDIHLDLRVARKKSGLTQRDCAHLLGTSATRISKLETGTSLPSLAELYLLSVIYGKQLETFLDGMVSELQTLLIERMTTLPSAPKRWLGRFNRTNTLQALALRLEAMSKQTYGHA